MAFSRGQPCLATCLPEAGSGDESELDRFSEKGTHFFSSASNSFGLDSGPKGSETLSHLISKSHHSNRQPATTGDPKGEDRREKTGDSTLQELGSYCPLSAGKPSLASSARAPCRASATCHLYRDQGARCMPSQVGPPVPRLQGSAPVSSGSVSLSRSLPIPTPPPPCRPRLQCAGLRAVRSRSQPAPATEFSSHVEASKKKKKKYHPLSFAHGRGKYPHKLVSRMA